MTAQGAIVAGPRVKETNLVGVQLIRKANASLALPISVA